MPSKKNNQMRSPTQIGSRIGNRNIFLLSSTFIGLAYQGKDIVFRFIIEYSSLMDFGP